MKVFSKHRQVLDVCGIVKLQPGANEISDDDWAKCQAVTLGHSTVPYMQWERSRGFLEFDDPTPVGDPEPVEPIANSAVADQSSGASDDAAAQTAQDAAPEQDPPKRKPGRPRKEPQE